MIPGHIFPTPDLAAGLLMLLFLARLDVVEDEGRDWLNGAGRAS